MCRNNRNDWKNLKYGDYARNLERSAHASRQQTQTCQRFEFGEKDRWKKLDLETNRMDQQLITSCPDSDEDNVVFSGFITKAEVLKYLESNK